MACGAAAESALCTPLRLPQGEYLHSEFYRFLLRTSITRATDNTMGNKKTISRKRPGRPLVDPRNMPSPVREHPNRLRELRLQGVVLSQQHVGRLMDIDDSTVSRHESGEMPMSKDIIVAYAQLYRVSTYELFLKPEDQSPGMKTALKEANDEILAAK